MGISLTPDGKTNTASSRSFFFRENSTNSERVRGIGHSLPATSEH
jgi:hypothetical protein